MSSWAPLMATSSPPSRMVGSSSWCVAVVVCGGATSPPPSGSCASKLLWLTTSGRCGRALRFRRSYELLARPLSFADLLSGYVISRCPHVVRRDPGGSVIGCANGLHQSLSAAGGVLASHSGLAMPLDVFALLASFSISVRIQATLIDAQPSRCGRRGRVRAWAAVLGGLAERNGWL